MKILNLNIFNKLQWIYAQFFYNFHSRKVIRDLVLHFKGFRPSGKFFIDINLKKNQ